MPIRVTDYWITPRVFQSKMDYDASVKYACHATLKYWEQGEVVEKALDGQYYTLDEFNAWYGRHANAFWTDAKLRVFLSLV